jgi:HD-GYP domain-containing protein (c-di-GMP phosphodiesterase class II)
VAAIIHDLGKIAIPSQILTKPTTLTDAEFNLLKTHPQVAYDVLKSIEFPWPIARIVLQHHEKINGSGYPQGLSGDQILIEAKIICAADSVEVMCTHRPYSPAMGINEALADIARLSGSLYDPNVVNACIKIFTEKSFKWS